ncbi:MAG: metallophosphoesterase family protein [Oscillospiraceae bacterium]
MTQPKGKAADLKFNENGKFRIMQIADIQDTQYTSKNTIKFIEAALDKAQPDLVVFTGDQIKGYGISLLQGDRDSNIFKAISNFLTPLTDRDIPFTFVFGNHDDQAFGITKEKQFQMYKSFDGCLAEIGDETIDGYANHYINIEASKEEKTAFNLYLIDSLSMSMDGFSNPVSEGQLNWYRDVRDFLKEENGKYIPSMVFQHIPVPEVWELLKEVPKGTKPSAPGYRDHADKFYWMKDETLVKGNYDFVLETPATPVTNGGEFDALSEKGDTIAIFFGHDHNNSFVGKYKNILLGYTQGCGFNVYGPDLNRGVRVIDLDETNPSTISSHTIMYKDLFKKEDIDEKLKFTYYKYGPTSFESVEPIIKKGIIAAAVTAGVLVGAKIIKTILK